jgi:hypothetical protein
LIHEVVTVYPADTNRIYFLGFSGGARVASMAAMYQVQVKGVIACGAGFGSTEQPIRYKFDYFGIAGTADFNMNEMLELDRPLTQAGFRQFITTFPGKHAWPPASVMEDAFCWITLNAMKDGRMEKDDLFLSGVVTMFGDRVKELKSNNQPVAAAEACREAISFVEGLVPADKFKEELLKIEILPDYQAQVAYRLSVLKKEEEEKQELMQALQSKDLTWWKARIKTYELGSANDEFKKKNINPEDTLKARRLMAFLSLFCYMNANAAVSRQNETAAVKILAIYEMADTANPEPNYMRAILLARRNENKAAIEQLKIAVTKGFDDKKRFAGQPEFRSLSNSPEWLDLKKTLK